MTDTESFERLAMVHLDAVYRSAVVLCANRDEAQDLTQTTFLKAFERFESFSSETDGSPETMILRQRECKAWLLKILRNSWIDRLRRQKVRGPEITLDEDLVEPEPPENEVIWTDAGDLLENFSDEQVIRALQALPEVPRLTLFLADVAGLSQEEIAEITGTAVGTVKSRTSRARAALKNKLADYAREMNLSGDER